LIIKKLICLLILVILLSGCTALLDGTNKVGDLMGVNEPDYYCEPITDNFGDYINRRCIMRRK